MTTRRTARVELSLDNALEYLRDSAVIARDAPANIEALGGGISNTVLRIDIAGDCFVVKQSLPKLRVSDYWPFDRRRIFVERDCMSALTELLPADSVPRVRFADESSYVLGMSCAPAGGAVWKQELLDGVARLETARQVGRLLAMIHNRTYEVPSIRKRFSSHRGFIQGRIDPYHRMIAKLHPDVRSLINAEVLRMLNTRLALVHGDYSPKNILAYPDHVLLLDFEVAHYGDPAFDSAFCLSHLVLKSIRLPEKCPEYLTAANEFWRSYTADLRSELAPHVELATIRELGCLLLARIDGKSKVEYITSEADRAFTRDLAKRILLGTQRSLDVLFAWLATEIAGRQLTHAN